VVRGRRREKCCFPGFRGRSSRFFLAGGGGGGGGHGNGQDSEEHAASFPLHILIPPTFS